MKLHDALAGAGLAALGGVVLWHIQSFPAMPGQKYGPAWFPGLIAAGLVLCGAILVVQGLRAAGPRQPWFTPPEWIRKPRPLAGVASVLGGLLFYVFAADLLGFYITGILLLTVWARLLGASWRMSFGVAVVATLVIHLSFYKLLRIPLPWGIFERFAF